MLDVRVGQTVQWFAAAKAVTPFAAIVLQVNPGGMLSLLSFDENGFPTRRQNVWRRGSQELDNSPNLATRFGCWEFVFPELEGTESGSNIALDSAESDSSRTRKTLAKKTQEAVA